MSTSAGPSLVLDPATQAQITLAPACPHCWHWSSTGGAAARGMGARQVQCCWCGQRAAWAAVVPVPLDMLPAVNGGDSGDQTPHSCFLDTAHGDSRLVFATYAPLGAFTLAKQPPNPVGLILSQQALLPVCPTVGAYAADAAKDGSRLSRYSRRAYPVFCNLC